jgi:hypothetical protein
MFENFSSALTSVQDLDIGDEVKFCVRKTMNKISAENVTKLSPGTIQTHVRNFDFIFMALYDNS